MRRYLYVVAVILLITVRDRLKVPAIRSVLEYLKFVFRFPLISKLNKGFSFLTLFVLFVWALEKNEESRLNTAELAFMVYGLGFALEKVATMQEHGMRVYFTGTWASNLSVRIMSANDNAGSCRTASISLLVWTYA